MFNISSISSSTLALFFFGIIGDLGVQGAETGDCERLEELSELSIELGVTITNDCS